MADVGWAQEQRGAKLLVTRNGQRGLGHRGHVQSATGRRRRGWSLVIRSFGFFRVFLLQQGTSSQR